MLTTGGPVDRPTGLIEPQVPGVAPQVVTQKQGAKEMRNCFFIDVVSAPKGSSLRAMLYAASSALFYDYF